MMNQDNNVFGEVIHSYTRKQAIEDGVLVDVTKLAKEVGWVTPVALTRAVWDRYVKIPDGVTGQDETGRLWDLLWICRIQARLRGEGPEMLFKLHVRNDNREDAPPLVTLKAHCRPGDDGAAVVTILLPDED